jgi:hypothetical protein
LTTNAINGSTITLGSIQGSLFSNGEYQNNQTTFLGSDIAGAINVAKISVKQPTFTITNDNSTSVSLVKNTSSTVTIFDGTLSSTNGTINVSDLNLVGNSGTV